jgi:hypothetical protein
MLRKYAVFFSFLFCIAAAGAFMIACGGSSSTPPPAKCTGSFNVVGDWQGTASSGGSSDDLFGTINSSGNVVMFDSLADMLVVSGFTGACSFSQTLTAYESVENGGPGTASGTVSGNVTSNSAITGSETSNGQTTGLTFNSYTPEATLAVPSGPTAAPIEGTVPLDSMILAFSGTTSSMAFTGTEDVQNCSVNGTFVEEAVSNVYDVTINFSGTNCTYASSYTGSGFESSSDLLDVNDGGAGVYLYGMITSGTPFVFEVLPGGGGDAADRGHVRANKVGIRNVFGFRHVAR